MAFENGFVPEDWRSAMIVRLYKGKGERTEFKTHRGISLRVVGKINARILVDRVHRVTGGLIDNEERDFRAGRRCVDQIFTLKQIGRKQERRNTMYVGFMDLKKAYNRVNREALWQVLRMFDVGGKHLNGIKSMYVDSSAGTE